MSEEKSQNKPNINPAAYFLSDMRVGFNHEIFHYVFLSGKEGIQHVSTPRMAKVIMQMLQEKIGDFEKQYGEIKMETTPVPAVPENPPHENLPEPQAEKLPEKQSEPQSKPSLGEKVRSTAGVVKQSLQDTKKTFEDVFKP